jgi:hypothetical protein
MMETSPPTEKTTPSPEILADFKSTPASPEDPKERLSEVQLTNATPANATAKHLFEDANDVVLRPYDYQDRQVAVAGAVVNFFWEYRLVAESRPNSIVIDVDGLGQAERAKLDAAIDKAGYLSRVRARIKGTIERRSLTTFVLAATDLALIDVMPDEQGPTDDLGQDFNELETLVVPVYPGGLFNQTIRFDKEARPDGGSGGSEGASTGGSGGPSGGGSDGASADGSSSAGSDGASADGSSGADSGSSDGGSTSGGVGKDKGKDKGGGKGGGNGKGGGKK